MVIGFLLAVFLIKALELGSGNSTISISEIVPSLSLAILIVPVFDIFRIIFVRMIHGKSPFKGDHNHIHHQVLLITGSHLKATSLILFVNIVLILAVILLRSLGNSTLIPFLLLISVTLSFLLAFYIKNNNTTA